MSEWLRFVSTTPQRPLFKRRLLSDLDHQSSTHREALIQEPPLPSKCLKDAEVGKRRGFFKFSEGASPRSPLSFQLLSAMHFKARFIRFRGPNRGQTPLTDSAVPICDRQRRVAGPGWVTMLSTTIQEPSLGEQSVSGKVNRLFLRVLLQESF